MQKRSCPFFHSQARKGLHRTTRHLRVWRERGGVVDPGMAGGIPSARTGRSHWSVGSRTFSRSQQRSENFTGRNADMNADGKSDRGVVPPTSANKDAVEASAESIEGRLPAARNTDPSSLARTQSRNTESEQAKVTRIARCAYGGSPRRSQEHLGPRLQIHCVVAPRRCRVANVELSSAQLASGTWRRSDHVALDNKTGERGLTLLAIIKRLKTQHKPNPREAFPNRNQ